MNYIIEVENLSKKYRISHQKEGLKYCTLRDELINTFKKPFLWLFGKKRSKEDVWALKNLSFKVKPGEILGIIGPNGAGKTTLLKLLTRITPPTKGKAIIRGKISSLLEAGTGFHPELTGRENIYLNGAILGMRKKEIDKKFDEIVDFSGVEKFLDTPLKRYSSGMSVRLAFSVAAHLDTDILLIDEVLAVGDDAFQKKSLSKMQKITKETGRTILFVSHNMASVINLCPRTILLDSGKIIMDGPTSSVIDKYMGLRKDNVSKAIWQDSGLAPGDGEVRLHKVRILSEDGKPISEADIQKDILIELSYWNLKEGANLMSSIHLINGQGVTVLTTFNGPSASLILDSWYDRKSPKGLFCSTCRIPGNFLNEGLYFVNVFIASHAGTLIVHVAEEKVISFDVVDTGAMRKEYSGVWLGAVRPRLAWNTEYQGNQEKI